MDQNEAPVLDALAEHQQLTRIPPTGCWPDCATSLPRRRTFPGRPPSRFPPRRTSTSRR
jgi:hypothetical protein